MTTMLCTVLLLAALASCAKPESAACHAAKAEQNAIQAAYPDVHRMPGKDLAELNPHWRGGGRLQRGI